MVLEKPQQLYVVFPNHSIFIKFFDNSVVVIDTEEGSVDNYETQKGFREYVGINLSSFREMFFKYEDLDKFKIAFEKEFGKKIKKMLLAEH